MDSSSRLTALPVEVLHHIFRYLAYGQPSHQLTTGKVDDSFRGLLFTCRSLHALGFEYYYKNTPFQCKASDLVWELIHMNPDPDAVQAFQRCVRRMQRLEVMIGQYGAINSAQIDDQIADLVSLRSCMERCEAFPTIKSLVLFSTGRIPAQEYVVRMPSRAPISEGSMYVAIFSPYMNLAATLKVEHRPSGETCSYHLVSNQDT